MESLSLDQASVRLPMRQELIGNFIRGSLHGGVISSTLDFMGGLVAFLSVLKTMQGQSVQAMAERFARDRPVDIRIDSLRPGVGDALLATGLRPAHPVDKVAVDPYVNCTTMSGSSLAVGTGACAVA